MNKYFLVLFVSLFLVSNISAAPLKVCSKEDGSIVVKKKCKTKKGQTRVDLSNLTGEKGDKGDKGDNGSDGQDGIIDLSSCYKKTDDTTGNGGAYSVTLNCNNTATEFVLRYYNQFRNNGIDLENNSIIRTLVEDGNYLTGVQFSKGTMNATFSNYAEIVCCNR